MVNSLEVLSTRAGFNAAIRHIKKTTGILDSLAAGENLADILFALDDLPGEGTAIILRMLLVDKFGYKTVSCNLSAAAEDLAPLAAEFARWKAVDLVAAYHHPDLGLLVANPKVAGELAVFGPLRKWELLVIYAGKAGAPADDLCAEAARLAIALFEGAKIKAPAALYNGSFAAPDNNLSRDFDEKPLLPVKTPQGEALKEEASARLDGAPAATKGPSRMTPLYSVAVQNEFFHNGNVEAWKRIIASYNARYPELKVAIYYEGERILDINSLFMWGKVKHGSSVQFAVTGNEIKDVAKLRRYLAQGASRHFEAFLRGPVNTTLNLF
jgi:hypothetical protein